MTVANDDHQATVASILDGVGEETIASVLVNGWRGREHELAVIIADEELTYGGLAERAVDFAAALIRLGVASGDKIGLISANTVEFVVGLFGTALAGGVWVPLTHRSTADELRFALELADIRVLGVVGHDWRTEDESRNLIEATVPGLADVAGSGELEVDSLPELRAVLWTDRVGAGDHLRLDQVLSDATIADMAAVGARAAAVAPDDLAAMIFTSGTESRPKAVMHSGRRMVGTALARWQEALHRQPGDRVWIPTPLCHTAALTFMLGALGSKLTFVTDAWFDADTAARTIEQRRCVTLWPQFHAILQGLEDSQRQLDNDFSHVLQVAVVGTRAAFDQGQALFPNARIFSGYGSTELNAFISCPDLGGEDDLFGTAGKPFSGIEVAMCELETGTLLPVGVEGELVIRGRALFLGYYKNEEATAAAIDADGWFHTGDLGVLHESGDYTWLGRSKELLKTGGINMSPVEVEAVLRAVDGVREAAVVGLPHPRLDEVPVVFVERDPDSDVTEQQLLDVCRAGLARYKVPTHLWWMTHDEWPTSLTKIDKKALARLAMERAGPAESTPQ